MRTQFNILNVLVLVALLFVSAIAQAAPDAGAKARGDVNNFYAPHRGAVVAQRYVAPAPAAVPAPALAQAEVQRRAFSAEPQAAKEAAPQGQWRKDRCGNWYHVQATTDEPATAAVEGVRKSYSYEPAVTVPTQTRGSRAPLYLLPKTDPRKFGP